MIEILDSVLTFLFTNDWAHLIAFSIIIPIIILIYTTRQSNRKNEELRKGNEDLSKQIKNATEKNNELNRKIQEVREKKNIQHSEALELKNVMKEHIEQQSWRAKSLKKVINIANPKTSKEFFLKALAEQDANFEERAMKNYEKVIELEPNKEMACIAYYNMGCICFDREETDAKLSLAIEYFEKVTEFPFEELRIKANAYCNIGTTYYKKQDYENAVKYYEKSIALIDTEIMVCDMQKIYNNIGTAYYRKQDYDNAIKYYEKTVELDEEDYYENQKAYSNLRFIYYHKKQDYDKAIEYCERITELELGSLDDAYCCMGNALYHKQELTKAIECYEKAIFLLGKRMKHNAQAYYNIGIAYRKKQELAKATEYYEKAIKLDQNYANVSYDKGIKDDEDFMTSYEEEVGYFSSIFICEIKDAYNNTGQKYMQKQDYDKAIEYYEKAIDLEPDVKTYHNLAQAYEAKGDMDKSLECKNKAKELGFEEEAEEK